MSVQYHDNQQARRAMRSIFEASDARLKAAVNAGEAIIHGDRSHFETPNGVMIERFGRALIVSCEFEQPRLKGGKTVVGLEVRYALGIEEFPDLVVEHLSTEDGYGDRPVGLARFASVADELMPLI